MDIDALSNFIEGEYLDSVSNCESESDSIKTLNYLEDFSYQNNLSSRARSIETFSSGKCILHEEKVICALETESLSIIRR
jgi:hypothetical protein